MHALLIYYFSQAVYLILAAVFAGFVCSMVNYFLPRPLLTRKYAMRVILCLIPVYLGFYTLLFWFCVAGFAQTPASGLILDTGILLGVHALARVAGLYIFYRGPMMEQDSLGGFYELLTGKHRCYRWKPGRFPLNKNEPGPSAGTFALAFLYMILFGIVLAAAVIPFNTYYVSNFIVTT